MSTPSVPKSKSILSKRHFGLAGVAAFIGCAACCAVPLLAAAGIGSGAVAVLSSVFRPGSELFVGGTVFVVALGLMAVRNRFKRSHASKCSSACLVDASCCGDSCSTPAEPEQLDGAFRWFFRADPEVEGRLHELARREHDCCRFFDFRITREGDSIVWETRGPKSAARVLEAFMRLPETLRREPTFEALSQAFRQAGLTFQ